MGLVHKILRRRFAAMMLAVVMAVVPGLALAQSLTDALIHAYRNSEILKSNQAQLRATDEGVAQAWASLRPSVTAAASRSYAAPLANLGSATFSDALTLSADLLIWDGGYTELGVEVARLNVAASRETLVDVEQGVLLNALTAFMDMRLRAQFLELAENNRDVIAQEVQAINDRFEVGDVTRTTVSQTEARFAAALSEVASAQGNLEIARQVYFVMVGEYPGTLLAPPPLPRLPATAAAATSIAQRSHPSVLRAKTVQKTAELNILRAQAAMKPKFTLSGSVGSRTTSGDTATLTLGGSVPIYRGGALVSAERQAIAIKERAYADVHQAGLIVEQNVVQQWARIEIAKASIVARQKQIRSARVALRGVREEAKLGARTTLDVLNQERELVRAQSDLVTAKRDKYVAVYSLLSAMGLLTVKHLKLGIKTYDTNANYEKVYLAPVTSKRGKLLDKIFTRAGKK